MKYRNISTGRVFTKEEWKKEYQAMHNLSGKIVSDEDAEDAFRREIFVGMIEEVEKNE